MSYPRLRRINRTNQPDEPSAAGLRPSPNNVRDHISRPPMSFSDPRIGSSISSVNIVRQRWWVWAGSGPLLVAPPAWYASIFGRPWCQPSAWGQRRRSRPWYRARTGWRSFRAWAGVGQAGGCWTMRRVSSGLPFVKDVHGAGRGGPVAVLGSLDPEVRHFAFHQSRVGSVAALGEQLGRSSALCVVENVRGNTRVGRGAACRPEGSGES